MKQKLTAVVLILAFLLAFGGQGVAFAQEEPLPETIPGLEDVTGLVAKSVNYDTVTVSWIPVAGATEYVVYFATAAAGPYKQAGVVTVPSYRGTKLATGKKYYFQVQARTPELTGNLSAPVSVKPMVEKPTKVKASSPSVGSVKVSWNKAAGATKYMVYRSRSASSGFKKYGVVTKTSFTDKAAYQGNTYHYKIVPYRGSVKGITSGTTKATSQIEPRIQAFLNAAKAELGKPYVLGGKGPSVFDCSGLIYYALNQSGYRIEYKTSYGWVAAKYPTITDFNQLQAGDILARPGHVAIYAGDNMVIEAVHAGVSYRQYWTIKGAFSCAKRIF